jgi:hypothetical protein
LSVRPVSPLPPFRHEMPGAVSGTDLQPRRIFTTTISTHSCLVHLAFFLPLAVTPLDGGYLLLLPGMLRHISSIQLPGEVICFAAMRLRTGSSLWHLRQSAGWVAITKLCLMLQQLFHCVKPEVYLLFVQSKLLM